MKSFIAFAALIACVSAGAFYQVPTVVQAPVSIPTVVKTGYSQTAFNVPESRFTRSDWSTPGATYAVPAVAQYTVTRPGYTSYQEGPSIVRTGYVPTSVPVATITKHQAVAAVPAVAPVVAKYAAPYAYAAPAYAPAYAPAAYW